MIRARIGQEDKIFHPEIPYPTFCTQGKLIKFISEGVTEIVECNAPKCETIYAHDNKLSNLDWITKLPTLTFLGLTENNLSDEVNFPNHTKLRGIDISPIDGDVSNINVKQISNLSNLDFVDVCGYNNLSGLESLDELDNLRCLWISENNLTEIPHLTNSSELYELVLSSNNLSNLENIQNFSNLHKLWIDDNTIEDLSHIKTLTKLSDLNLSNNNISSIDQITNLVNLKELDLHKNLLGSNFINLSSFVNITKLDLGGNSITKFPYIDDLKKLETLRIDNNKITHLSGINNLSLKNIYISQNPIIYFDVNGLNDKIKIFMRGTPLHDKLIDKKGDKTWYDVLFEENLGNHTKAALG